MDRRPVVVDFNQRRRDVVSVAMRKLIAPRRRADPSTSKPSAKFVIIDDCVGDMPVCFVVFLRRHRDIALRGKYTIVRISQKLESTQRVVLM